MKSSYNNYKKKKLKEEKALKAELAAKKKKTVTIIISVVALIIVVAAVVIAVVFSEKNSIGNNEKETNSVTTKEKTDHTLPEVYDVVKVNNDDMKPVFSNGDNIAVLSVESESELKVGDIIYYLDYVKNGKKVCNALRINEIIEENGSYFYEVKADTKEEPEAELVGFNKVIGKYYKNLGSGNVFGNLNDSSPVEEDG